ncbi:coiled-coil domain containing 96 [Phyllostomus discolor]|uniref:Coiled-coil domain containing 96 n=1 Tax=Phyllostomus discolor TaxID=89673 RepID=A0A6J2KZS0_9CHIR|nr:coiled-coil domain-containing protein 96-like [Phyllostomus discolor]KAF6129213.1 coiled-coil domain containing 96 [Phyllostomus discolor]
MDNPSDPSEPPGASETKDGDVVSLASRLSGIKVSSGPQSPAEPTEPEPEAVETSEGEVAAAEPPETAEPPEPAEPAEPTDIPELPEPAGSDEPADLAKLREGPAATEAEGEESRERAEPVEAEPEEPAEPGSAGGPKEPEEKEREEAPEDKENEKEEEASEEERKKAPLSISLQLYGAARETVEPILEEEAEYEEIESKGVEGSRAKSDLWQKDQNEQPEFEDSEWTEEVQRLQEEQLRSELLDQYRSLMVERSHYQRYNSYLQHKICQALRKKKGLDVVEAPDMGPEPEAPEKEHAYISYLAVLEELRKQRADDLAWYHQELAQLKQQCKENLSRVEKEWRRFQALKKQVVMQAMGSCRMRGGRKAALREVEQLQALEEKKEKEMSAVRLENVQLKQSLVHFETRMRAQEDTTEGLLLIDFEQLKIENQTFNEKVEERNEELLKLRNKVDNNVRIITHVKEMLHFVDIENAGRNSQLLEADSQVALRRDILTKTKQARDGLRIDNVRLSRKCGLLGKEALLRDMEEKAGKTALLKERLESLKRHHAGLTLSCKGMRRKIREAKAFLPS